MKLNSSKEFWNQKPKWCQPWSIISFGICFISLIWIISHNITITLVVSFLIICWWFLFLVLVPKTYEDNI